MLVPLERQISSRLGARAGAHREIQAADIAQSNRIDLRRVIGRDLRRHGVCRTLVANADGDGVSVNPITEMGFTIPAFAMRVPIEQLAAGDIIIGKSFCIWSF